MLIFSVLGQSWYTCYKRTYVYKESTMDLAKMVTRGEGLIWKVAREDLSEEVSFQEIPECFQGAKQLNIWEVTEGARRASAKTLRLELAWLVKGVARTSVTRRDKWARETGAKLRLSREGVTVRNSPWMVYVSGNDVILFMFLMDHHGDK